MPGTRSKSLSLLASSVKPWACMTATTEPSLVSSPSCCQGKVIGFLGRALETHDARGFFDPAAFALHGPLDRFMLSQESRLRQLQNAVLMDGFHGDGHDGDSKTSENERPVF
jgi:hypothetical protein